MDLKTYRQQQKLTQRTLAGRLGISQGMVSHLETGRVALSAKLAKAIEDVTAGALTLQQLRPDLFTQPSAQRAEEATPS